MNRSGQQLRVIEVQQASRVAAVQTADGPRAILEAGLLDALASAGASADLLQIPGPDGPTDPVGEAFATARHVAVAVREAVAAGRRVLVLSGPCHTAIGSACGLREEGRRGVIWLDTHPDFNTPDTTESGLLDGMALATLTGRCWTRLTESVPGFLPVRDEDVLLVGVRELDRGEESLLAGAAVRRLSVSEVREGRLHSLESLAERVDSVYLHLDLDVLDTSEGVANSYAMSGGLTIVDLEGFLRAVSPLVEVEVMGLTAYDPSCDADRHIAGAAIRAATAMLG
jgi:arginase